MTYGDSKGDAEVMVPEHRTQGRLYFSRPTNNQLKFCVHENRDSAQAEG